jgi:hypothetical protein
VNSKNNRKQIKKDVLGKKYHGSSGKEISLSV